MPFTLLQSKFVKHNPGAGGSGTSLTFVVAFNSNVSVGSSIVVAAIAKSGIRVSTVTDTLGNTYKQVFPNGTNGADSSSECWVANNSPAGSNTVTVTYASSSFGYVCCAEYATGGQIMVPDQGAWARGISGASPLSLDTGAPPTSINANELVVCWGGTLSVDSVTYTAGSGFTIEQQDAAAGPSISFFYEDKVVSSTGAFHGLASVSGANVPSGNFVIIAMPFFLVSPSSYVTLPIQSASRAQTTNATSNALAFPSNNHAGNVIIVMAIAFNSAPPTLSVADSQGNSYTTIRGPDSSTADTSRTQSWIARNIKAGANTVTLSLSVSQTSIIVILEYTPLGNLDQSVWQGSETPGASQHLDSGPATTISPNELVITYGGTENVPGQIDARQGFFLEQMQDDETGVQAFAVSDQDLSALATLHGTSWIGGLSTATWQQALISFLLPTPTTVLHNIDAVVSPSIGNPLHHIDAQIFILDSTTHNIDSYIFIPPKSASHFLDVFISNFAIRSYVRITSNIIFPIISPNYVRLNGALATPNLSFVNVAGTIIGRGISFTQLVGTIQSSVRSYVKLVGSVQKPTYDIHDIDVDISIPELSYIQIVGTIRGSIQQGPCGSFPDASYVNLEGWIVAPGDSVQMPNSGFTSADDFLSSQIALAAYKPMSVFILNGIALIVTAFTTGVVSWQTRTRSWLRRVDAAPNGILLTSKVNTHTLPNGAVITTTTEVRQNQDVVSTTVTIQNSATPLRTSQIITEKSKSGHTTTVEKETNNANGVLETTTKTVFSKPPTTENIQPLKVTTLDGVQHYQFFGVDNQEWAGGDQEGTTVSKEQTTIVGTTKTTQEIVDTPDGKHIETTTTIQGSPEAGTTTTEISSEFQGTQTTVHKVITYPNGATTTIDTVTNDVTGDSVETQVETVTDEFGQVTITTTKTETTTFVDPTTGLTRTVETKTITVNKGGVITTDSQVDTTNDFEDDIYTQKVQVIFIQEFTLNVVIDEMSMFGLWEINETQQKNYALLELFGQQLGNLNLSYLLRQSLIDQFNTANSCVKPVTLQANGKTYQVVFAPSASAFRAKYIPGTEPHVYELQMILQERSNLINGTQGFF